MTVSIENKTFLKRIATLSLPIMMQEVLNASVNMVDNFMVGSLGLHSVTAVGLANLVFFLFMVVVFGINSGSAIYHGQFWGKKDVKSIHKTMGLAWITGIVLGIIVTMAVILAAPQIMAFYSKDDEQVIALGVTYLHSVAPVYLLLVCIGVINSALRSVGQTKLPLFSTSVGLVCNVIFNALFIFVLDMGVQGAAIATVIARSAELCVQILVTLKLKIPIVGHFKNYFSFDWTFVKGYYKLITPVVMNEFMWALGTMLYAVMYKTTGTEGQGAQQIAATVQNIFMVMGMGVGSGCAIMISNSLGAGEIKQAISYSRKSLVLAICVSIVMSLLLILIAPFFIGFYNVPDLVKGYAYNICLVIAAGMVPKTINFTFIIGILRSGGDTTFCLIVDGLTVWIVALPLLWLGGYVWHLPIYFLVALTYAEEAVKLFFCLRRTFSNCWARNLVENI